MEDAIPYQVIARKYRPQTFASVVGQESIVTTLKNALRFQRLAHAYLFCGCRGTGKTTLARLFAKALNCQHPTPDFEPCNACPSCLDVTSGRSLDVLEIDGASNRGIDDMRQINETVGYAPALGKYKIYIIDEVHMLTKEAFNALLKTLEEPPAHVKFFFATTEPHKILPTILSRCQRFDLNRIAFDTLKEKLLWITQDLKVPCEEEVLSLVATLAEGSLRDAESLLDQIICYADHPITLAKVSSTLGIMPRTVFFALDHAFNDQNFSYAFELASDLFSSGKDLNYFLDHLIEHYRALLKLKLDPGFLFPTAKLKEQYTASLPLYTEEQCVYILDFLIQSQQQIHKTPFKRVHLEMLLLHLIRSKYRLTLPSLVKRLQELEKQLLEAPKSVSIPVAVEKSPAPSLILEAPKEVPQESIPVAMEKVPAPSLILEAPKEVPQESIPVAMEKVPAPSLILEAPKEVPQESIPVAMEKVPAPSLILEAPKEVPQESIPVAMEKVPAPTLILEAPKEVPQESIPVAMEKVPAPTLILEAPKEVPQESIPVAMEKVPDPSPILEILNEVPIVLEEPEHPIAPAQKPSLDELLIHKIQKKLDSLPAEQPPAPFILSKEEWKTKAAGPQRVEEVSTEKVEQEPFPQGCHYDTLLRFAAVELEGVIKTSTK